jgi:hypothetical protein
MIKIKNGRKFVSVNWYRLFYLYNDELEILIFELIMLYKQMMKLYMG